MKALTYSAHALITLLTLAACELPTKVGELTASSGPEPSDSTDSASSDGQTEPELTTGTTDEPGTSAPSSLSEPTSEPVGETETEGPPGCEAIADEEACKAASCLPLYGVAYDFPGCSEGQVYLGCIEPQDCDDAETDVCREGAESEEAYKLKNGCYPAGFVPCEPSTDAFCDQCEALDEAGCLAEPSECQPIYGAPHVDVGGEVCVDFNAQEFLRCVANGGACPPFVPTICPIGQPDKPYDSPSGCIPSGYEMCEGGGTPECQ
jgi:hypothetical protein